MSHYKLVCHCITHYDRFEKDGVFMEKMDLNSPKKTVTPFSLLGGDMGENPFPYFSQMRETGAVIRVPNPMGGQAWLVTRMEEAVQVLKDHVRYTVDASTLNGNSKPVDPSEPSTFVNGKSMNFVDEPDHKRLRGLVSKAFTPRYMDSLRPRIQELADELLDQVQARGQMDLVKDYAYPLPINVISEMLGVPPVDREQIHAWSDSLARGLGAEKREPAVTENLRIHHSACGRQTPSSWRRFDQPVDCDRRRR
jgi:cytochrome P450